LFEKEFAEDYKIKNLATLKLSRKGCQVNKKVKKNMKTYWGKVCFMFAYRLTLPIVL
jgi:hypothetical protein